jgi:hypothetical protein
MADFSAHRKDSSLFFPCHPCLCKRIAKLSSATNLIKSASKETTKGKSSRIIFTARKTRTASLENERHIQQKAFLTRPHLGVHKQKRAPALDRNNCPQTECRESCTTRGVVEDLQVKADGGAKLSHS